MLRPSISRIAAQAGVRRAFSSTPARPVAKITLVGNLTNTPELQATSTGRELLTYTVASNSGPRDEAGHRQASFFRVAAFENEGPRRDFLQGLAKGTLVYVEGDATMNTYTDSEGKNRTALNIVQRQIDVLRRPRPVEEAEPFTAAGAQ